MAPQYNASETEKTLREAWQQDKTYEQRDEQQGKPVTTQASRQVSTQTYTIDTPPPTISGSLHIGHVFSYTQADIIARYKRLDGYSVFYPMGFDNNGRATERFVEKTHHVHPLALGRSAFIQLCLQQTEESEKQFKELFEQLGLSVDWSKTYSTISTQARRISQQSFVELYHKGHVYRKEEPALYCPTCRTSVAQAELEDIEKTATFNEVVFTTEQGKSLVIATTRPELLASCVALLYNPCDTRYQGLETLQARVPLYGHMVPIITDTDVVVEKGTGLVMCCTFGDQKDIEWFKKYQLPYRPSIDQNGYMTDQAGFLKGKKVSEARTAIIQELKNAGLLLAQKAITHHVLIDERCKQEIEYLALPQWFLSILPHKATFIELANRIEWSPAFMKARYINWVENIHWDWCLSRQKYYGIPFPVWHCTRCASCIFADEKSLPVDPQETPCPLAACPQCGNTDLTPDTDVMDTWNTSSLTPYICRELYGKQDSSFLPMSMRPQAHDIIRTWAFYTIVKVWLHDQKIPWKDIVISGHVLTGKGEKISKSQANSPLVPENLLKMYPADVIRYWTASAKLGYDVAFSETQLKIGHRLLTKLWNAFRFIEEHMQGYRQKPESGAVEGTINQWIMHQATKTHMQYQQSFNSYEFGPALEAIERFFWHDFCDNYLEFIKDQLFSSQKINEINEYPAQEVAHTRQTLAQLGISILQWLAPFMPYITDSLYRNLYREHYKADSIHQTLFSGVHVIHEYPDAVDTMDIITAVNTQVRKLKSDCHLSLKTALETLTIVIEAKDYQKVITMLSCHETCLKGITKANTIMYQVAEETPAQIPEKVTPNLEVTDSGNRALVFLGNHN